MNITILTALQAKIALKYQSNPKLGRLENIYLPTIKNFIDIFGQIFDILGMSEFL